MTSPGSRSTGSGTVVWRIWRTESKTRARTGGSYRERGNDAESRLLVSHLQQQIRVPVHGHVVHHLPAESVGEAVDQVEGRADVDRVGDLLVREPGGAQGLGVGGSQLFGMQGHLF